MSDETQIAVTICQTGRRTPRRVKLVGPIVTPSWMRFDRTEMQQRADREMMMAVGRNNPERRDAKDPDDRMLGSALGRFCLAKCPRSRQRAVLLFLAGQDYAKDVRHFLTTAGHFVAGMERSVGNSGGEVDISEDAVKVSQEAIDTAKAKMTRADAELFEIMPRLPAIVKSLCVGGFPVNPENEDIVDGGLYRLACHYGRVDFGINWDKPR